jgi:tripartite-type tricarboxylate transporter receptor subunit TctC
VKGGKMRALALTGDRRSRTMPEVPTLKELGIDVSANAWWGILAPAATPKPIVDKLVIEIRRAIALPEVESMLTQTLGMEVIALGPDATQKWIVDAIARWGKVVRDNGVKIE